jgi:glycerol uptake facilitator-like aquaporin
MLIKIFIVVMLIAMLVSLFTALYFMFTDRGRSERTVKALSWRIGIWVVLLALLALGTWTGVIKPSNSLGPAMTNLSK